MNAHLKLMLMVIVAALITITHAEAGKIYTWEDGHGQLHYGDSPPPGSEYYEIATVQGDLPNRHGSGLRQGELELLEYASRKEARLRKARRSLVKKQAADHRRCAALSKEYHHVLTSSGKEDRSKIRQAHRRMQAACH